MKKGPFVLPMVAAASLISCGGGAGSDVSYSTPANCGQPGTRCVGIVEGMEYILYTPATFKANTSALVMALHPRYSTGQFMEALTGLNAKADQIGFAVLYPTSPGQRMWCWYFQPCNDVPRLRTLLSTAQGNLKADPKRIYVTGYSDGAEMAHRVGVELGDVVAAIAPVCGDLYEGQAGVIPATTGAVSVLILHGDFPPNKSFYVCGYDLAGIWIPPQDDVFDFWTGPSANGCSTFETAQKICSINGLQLSAKNAKSCNGSTEVQFYQLINGTHPWFNVPGNWSVPLNNPTSGQPYNLNFNATTGITANDIIWNFFAAHPKP